MHKRALVPFLIGLKYKDVVWCDVVYMDGFHLLLGRPWQYDRDVNHNGWTNTYSFIFDGVKIVLLPSRQVLEKPKVAGEATALLSLARVDEELQKLEIVYRLLEKGVVHGKAAAFMDSVQAVHQVIDQKLRHLKFNVGDFVWAEFKKVIF